MRGPGERGGAVCLRGVHVCAAADEAASRRPVLPLRGLDEADVACLGSETAAASADASHEHPRTRPLQSALGYDANAYH